MLPRKPISPGPIVPGAPLREISSRIHGVFVVNDHREYVGEPLPTGTYFRSTVEASRFLGYRSDVVGRDIRIHWRRWREPFADKRGVWFVAAREAFAKNYQGAFNAQLRRLFPSVFKEIEDVSTPAFVQGSRGHRTAPDCDFSI